MSHCVVVEVACPIVRAALKAGATRPQGPWPHRAALAARPRRRGDRIEMHFAALHESGSGTKRSCTDVPSRSALGGIAESALSGFLVH